MKYYRIKKYTYVCASCGKKFPVKPPRETFKRGEMSEAEKRFADAPETEKLNMFAVELKSLTELKAPEEALAYIQAKIEAIKSSSKYKRLWREANPPGYLAIQDENGALMCPKCYLLAVHIQEPDTYARKEHPQEKRHKKQK